MTRHEKFEYRISKLETNPKFECFNDPNKGKVHFLGELNAFEQQELMKKISALVITSYNEAFSSAALRATSLGACVIGTPVGILPELVREDWQVINDVDTLAHAMEKARRGSPAKLAGYDKEKLLKAQIGLYKRLLCLRVEQKFK